MKFYQIQFTDLIKKLNPKRNLRVHELPYFRKKATAERYLTELFGSSILDRLTSNIILIEVNNHGIDKRYNKKRMVCIFIF